MCGELHDGGFRKGRTALQGARFSQWRETRYTEGRKQSSLAICRQQGAWTQQCQHALSWDQRQVLECGLAERKLAFLKSLRMPLQCSCLLIVLESMDRRRDGWSIRFFKIKGALEYWVKPEDQEIELSLHHRLYTFGWSFLHFLKIIRRWGSIQIFTESWPGRSLQGFAQSV